MSGFRRYGLRAVQCVQDSLSFTSRGLRTLAPTTAVSPQSGLQTTHRDTSAAGQRLHACWDHTGAGAHFRCLHSSPAVAALQASGTAPAATTLNTLTAGGRKYRKRRARGGGDKTAGRGKNGQKSRRGTGSPALFFEGGQTPLWKRLPRRGFTNRFSYSYDSIPLNVIAHACAQGRLDPRHVITMKHLFDAGLMGKSAYNRNGAYVIGSGPPQGWSHVMHLAHSAAADAAARDGNAQSGGEGSSAAAEAAARDGIAQPGVDGSSAAAEAAATSAAAATAARLAAAATSVATPAVAPVVAPAFPPGGGGNRVVSSKRARDRRPSTQLQPWFTIPIQLEIANISATAQQAIEDAGGKVTKVYYNKLGIRALLLPDWFPKKGRMLPHAVQMVPYKKAWRYDRVGTLPTPSAPGLSM